MRKITFSETHSSEVLGVFPFSATLREFLPDDLQLDTPALEKWASPIISYNRKGCNHCLVPLYRSCCQKRGLSPWRQTLMRSSCSTRSWTPWKWRLRSMRTCRWRWWRLVWHGNRCAAMGKEHIVATALASSELPFCHDYVIVWYRPLIWNRWLSSRLWSRKLTLIVSELQGTVSIKKTSDLLWNIRCVLFQHGINLTIRVLCLPVCATPERRPNRVCYRLRFSMASLAGGRSPSRNLSELFFIFLLKIYQSDLRR